MPVLAGLLTYLALSGTPGLWVTYAAKAEDTGAKENLTGITGLSPGGVPGRSYGTLSAKDAATADARSVGDTYRLVYTLGDVSEVSAALTERYVLALGMTSVAGDTRAVADTYLPSLTLGVGSLQKATGPTFAAADSYVPALTLAPALVSAKSATDSYVPVLGMACTVSTSNLQAPTDSYVPVLTLSYTLESTVGTVAHATTDSYVPVLTLTAAVQPSGDVDRIRITARPCGRILIREV